MNEGRLGNDRGGSSEVAETVSRETLDGEDVSTTVVLVVEELTGTPMEELSPLQQRINIDALNALFKPGTEGDSNSATGTLRFEYAGCRITVDSGGSVLAQRLNQGGLDDTQREGEARET